MNDVDIARIQFDYDLVFAVVFMNANGRIYSRYGGRTPWNSASRVSLTGLKYTMRQVVGAHDPSLQPANGPAEPMLARDLLTSKRSCMHCHEVWEGLRKLARKSGNFDPRSLFVYPRPENIGLTVDVDVGNRIQSVKADSACAQVGLRAGDRIDKIGKYSIYSQADISWALHNAPETGQLMLRFTRDGTVAKAIVPLDEGWKESKLSWRASMRKEESPPRQTKRRKQGIEDAPLGS